MAKPKNAGDDRPGAPLAQFVAAVNAIAELRDAGKALVFLRANGRVSIIRRSPSTADILPQLTAQLKGEAISESKLKQTVNEIEQTISVVLSNPNEVDATKQILFHSLEDFGHESKLDTKIPSHEHILKKVQAAGKLSSQALRQRLIRLRSVTIPSLEELDVELVQDRRDSSIGKHIGFPFLRLRVRYSEGASLESDGFPVFLYGLSTSSKSFELECDLIDLDLLQQRLDEARQILLDAVTVKEVGDDKK